MTKTTQKVMAMKRKETAKRAERTDSRRRVVAAYCTGVETGCVTRKATVMQTSTTTKKTL